MPHIVHLITNIIIIKVILILMWCWFQKEMAIRFQIYKTLVTYQLRNGRRMKKEFYNYVWVVSSLYYSTELFGLVFSFWNWVCTVQKMFYITKLIYSYMCQCIIDSYIFHLLKHHKYKTAIIASWLLIYTCNSYIRVGHSPLHNLYIA